MTPEQFKALKPGDEVIFRPNGELGNSDYPADGTRLTRFKSWLDDGVTDCFVFDSDGVSEINFFKCDELEVVSG